MTYDGDPASTGTQPEAADRDDPRPRIQPGLLGSVLTRLTDPVLIVDRTGDVVWWNRALAGRLGEHALRARGARCCALLGCPGDAAEAGEPACLTALALEGDGFTGRRVRLPGSPNVVPHEAVVTAHIVGVGESPAVAFEVRLADGQSRPGAGEAAPRRLRTVPTGEGAAGPDVPGSVLLLATLGPLRVSVGGRRLDGDWLQQRAAEIFRYLVCTRTGVAAPEDIAAAIWPERSPSAGANVRYCIYKLRERLDGPDRAVRSFILHSPGGYRLDPARIRLDVDIFQAKVAAGLAAHTRGEVRLAEGMLADAVGLYRGDFLADDPYAEWAFPERDYLRAQAAKALSALGELALGERRLGAAAVHLERLARLEPFDSKVHELLIEVCLRRGRRTDALRHYTNLRRRVLDAFGEQPGFELAEVAARIARPAPPATRTESTIAADRNR